MTPQQAKVFRFIDNYWRMYGCSPSFEEICSGLSLKSKGSVAAILDRMQARGYVTRDPAQRRSISITKYPENYGGEAPPNHHERIADLAACVRQILGMGPDDNKFSMAFLKAGDKGVNAVAISTRLFEFLRDY